MKPNFDFLAEKGEGLGQIEKINVKTSSNLISYI